MPKDAPRFPAYQVTVFTEKTGLIVFQGNVNGAAPQDTIWKMVGEHAQMMAAQFPGGERGTFKVEVYRTPF